MRGAPAVRSAVGAATGAALLGVLLAVPAAESREPEPPVLYRHPDLRVELSVPAGFVECAPRDGPAEPHVVWEWFDPAASGSPVPFRLAVLAFPSPGGAAAPGPEPSPGSSVSQYSMKLRIRSAAANPPKSVAEYSDRLFAQRAWFGEVAPMSELWTSAAKGAGAGGVPFEFVTVGSAGPRAPRGAAAVPAVGVAGRAKVSVPGGEIELGLVGMSDSGRAKRLVEISQSVLRTVRGWAPPAPPEGEDARAGSRRRAIERLESGPWVRVPSEYYVVLRHRNVDAEQARSWADAIEAFRRERLAPVIPPASAAPIGVVRLFAAEADLVAWSGPISNYNVSPMRIGAVAAPGAQMDHRLKHALLGDYLERELGDAGHCWLLWGLRRRCGVGLQQEEIAPSLALWPLRRLLPAWERDVQLERDSRGYNRFEEVANRVLGALVAKQGPDGRGPLTVYVESLRNGRLAAGDRVARSSDRARPWEKAALDAMLQGLDLEALQHDLLHGK